MRQLRGLWNAEKSRCTWSRSVVLPLSRFPRTCGTESSFASFEHGAVLGFTITHKFAEKNTAQATLDTALWDQEFAYYTGQPVPDYRALLSHVLSLSIPHARLTEIL